MDITMHDNVMHDTSNDSMFAKQAKHIFSQNVRNK